ncbi:hypothetical protein [Demequina silvatica]|uniref:hypothetical protein n=1 Tax=Demequina silvatica TaxID=1638988 RepID=UPI001E34081D|nr:hypothetical protein [Demequina silvatica]
MTVESTNARSGAGISRRRLVQGAAWATPAVLIATAAPAFAGSDPLMTPLFGVVGNSGKQTITGSGGTAASARTVTATVQRVDNNSTYAITRTEIRIEFQRFNRNGNTWVAPSWVIAGDGWSEVTTETRQASDGKQTAPVDGVLIVRYNGPLADDAVTSGVSVAFTNVGTIALARVQGQYGGTNTMPSVNLSPAT